MSGEAETLKQAEGAKRSPKPSIVHVRLPEDGDWAAVRSLVRQFHQRTIFAAFPFSESKFDELEKQVRSSPPNECVIVAEARGELVGLAWFSAGEYIIGEGGLMTTTHLIAVDTQRCSRFLSAKVFTRLVRGIVLWSKSRNAKHVLIHVTTGTAIKETDRLLRAGGARVLGGGYVIDV
ncbi:hypothetical protein NL532_15865 [Mesorhizobium sp. C120A]|uniref:hypothetical protein n=1 Tax=unclassified Mesorhizobium TaxID=325217 RepID=UPI0003D06248|nr:MULTISPECIES: hypothetical protein [unclassified Mesorhizobium]ESZ55610.1 hypothetical protein X728_28955 [Mesorhizobium sp. L103C120A0]WJI48000.1 hypothetical protein NL532_15865 [Mesorhizobium sp. C120A]